ncbi:MAG: tRNA (adenosine(37)-N6)-threonylcarbamoyltransferase complex ATPase subunit type 1 TsaE [Flavobacteriales bacterium]|nr:tRNA (adenosine(37)-N6)-threonylcarbamoyltransferase complex ATPase subunit type 1 TsaE [Flavobacteriales bacterium]
MSSAEDAQDLACRLLHAFRLRRRVFALHGDLGAGKTTLIKAFCSVLGVKDRTSSPSFAIVNEYQRDTGEALYHFDLYRLKAAEELEGIGFNEYLDSGAYCFIEWPELAGEFARGCTAVLGWRTTVPAPSVWNEHSTGERSFLHLGILRPLAVYSQAFHRHHGTKLRDPQTTGP